MEYNTFTVKLESTCKFPVPRALELFYQLCDILAQDSIMTNVEYSEFLECIETLLHEKKEDCGDMSGYFTKVQRLNYRPSNAEVKIFD